MPSRKYSIEEIDQMRNSLEWSYPSGVSYRASERSAEVEDRLRTHMQNGTVPSELKDAANRRIEAEVEHQKVAQEFYRKQREVTPAPKPLLNADDVLEAWFARKVAKYEGASTTAKELYDSASTFASQRTPSGVHISQRCMERFLDKRGCKSRSAMFAKRYDGICQVLHGDVLSGNYGT